MNAIPTLSVDLIEQLDKTYPPILGGTILSTDRETLIAMAARRELVELLKHRLETTRKSTRVYGKGPEAAEERDGE